MLAGVIFDLDGTLGDTLPVCFAAFREVFARHLGVTYGDDEIREMFGPTEEGILAGRIPIPDGDPMAEYLAAYARAHHMAPGPFPGIVDLLDSLERRAVPVAVVTGKGPRSTSLTLERWGIADRFDRVEAGGDHGNIKADNMRAVVTGWGADPAAVVSVGDVVSDITAAHEVGIVAVGAAWAPTTEEASLAAARPDALFTRVEELEAWLALR